MAATCIRWLLKSLSKNEYNEGHKNEEIVEICKFCQIRDKSAIVKSILVYSDDKFIAF